MIDSDQRPVSSRRPLLKSASTDVIISNRRPFQTLISIGSFTRSKFAIKNNCNDRFRVKVRVRVNVRVRVRIKIRARIKVRVRVMVNVKVRVH
jgi:hypothetical protein